MKVLLLLLFPTMIFANEVMDKKIKTLSKHFSKNRSDVESFKKLNDLLILKGKYITVEKNLSNYDTYKIEYNKIRVKELYYKNSLIVDGNFFTRYSFKGANTSIFYRRTFEGVNKIGLGLQNESRNFSGNVKNARSLTIEYQRKLSINALYQGSLESSPENSFLPKVSLQHILYFNYFRDSSSFAGVKTSKYVGQDFFNTFFVGNEYYYKDNIFHVTFYGLVRDGDFSPSLSLAHTYYFNYRSFLKSTIGFGDGLDDYNIYGNFKQFNLKYTYQFHNLEPFVQSTYYNSNYRKEYSLGAGIRWSF